MGISKIRRQGPGKDSYVHQFPVKYNEDKLVQEDRFQVGEDDNNGSDDSDLSDTGCEYAMVNDQISNIPYELYELSNMKDILCLESWNLCLTEEERFDLAAYLPDMDQETFDLTMLELFRGDSFYFGSPLDILFHRLKGGFYSLQVTRFREGLKFIQERGHYQSLRSYHEGMTEKFAEMRKAWSNSQPNTNVEEHIKIWKNKNNQRTVFPVDLNAFPLDEELTSKGNKRVMGLLPKRKTTFINKEIITYVPSMDSNCMTLNSRRKAKGVLKLKPPEVSSTPKQIVLTLPSETWEPIKRPPKGVLKLKPKGNTTNIVERPRVNGVPHGQGSGIEFDVQTHSLSTSQRQDNISKTLYYVHQLAENGSIHRGCTLSEIDSLNICSSVSDTRISRKLNVGKCMRMSSGDSSDIVECFNSQQKGAIWTSSGSYQPDRDHNRRELMPLRTSLSEAVSSNLITANDYVFPSFDHSEHQHRDMDGAGVQKSCKFPITYKRKKPHTKLSALKNQIKLSAVASIAPALPAGINFNQVEKTKAIRIRVKGWSELSSQYKQGVLDGQHLGSPAI